MDRLCFETLKKQGYAGFLLQDAPERVVQFGEGNFLRAFLGDFIDTLRRKGLYGGKIVIVTPTNSKNTDAINAAGGRYHLVKRGILNGETVNEIKEIDKEEKKGGKNNGKD